MRVVQSTGDGGLQLEETVRPGSGPTDIVLETRSSLITATGATTPRHLARSTTLDSESSVSDAIRKVVRRTTAYGVRDTVDQVKAWNAGVTPIGYSAAGIVLEVGEGVRDVRPGQRVAAAGAPHSEISVIKGQMVARLPDQVSFDEGAFAAVGSVALNALRTASLEPGSKLLVVGLDLIGQLVVRLAIASGVSVVGLDGSSVKQALVEKAGAYVVGSDIDGWAKAIEWTKFEGFDTVMLTTDSETPGPMKRSAESARHQGLIVLVGETGLHLDRRAVYDRELTVKIARSFETGQQPSGLDHREVASPGRWTVRRNMEAVLSLVASDRLDVGDLISHRFGFEQAIEAFGLSERGDEGTIGIVLQYDQNAQTRTVLDLTSDEPEWSPREGDGAGLIGADERSHEFVLPAAKQAGFDRWTVIASPDKDISSRIAGSYGFDRAVADPAQVISDPTTATVFVSANNDRHASLIVDALKAGKNAFCAQPLALTEEELEEVVETYRDHPGVLMVGFNRRWSQPITDTRSVFELSDAPVQILYRVSAGTLPQGHQLTDSSMGGRLLGEAGHYIDTCNAIVGKTPTQLVCLTSGSGELWMEEDFTITIGYSNGSQAIIVYSASSSIANGRERIEILGAGNSVVIDNYNRLQVDGPPGTTKRRYRPTDKGHRGQMKAFAELLKGTRDRREIAQDAFTSTQMTIAAVQSAMTRKVVTLST